jgi:hypothetical protein
MNAEKLAVRIELTEPLLGTCSGNPELHEEFVIAKVTEDKGPRKEDAAKLAAEEKATLTDEAADAAVTKMSTVFAHDEFGLFLWDYELRGFVKEALRTMIELGDCKLSKWTYKRAVDSTVFVYPRRLRLGTPGSSATNWAKAPERLQRPIRVDTLRGERVALANSELVPIGTWLTAEIHLLAPSGERRDKSQLITMAEIAAALDYGQYKGLGQWRGGGWGRFKWSKIEATAK